MASIDIVAKCAVEWWQADGPRHIDRLTGLVDHFADSYGLTGEARGEAFDTAVALAKQRFALEVSA